MSIARIWPSAIVCLAFALAGSQPVQLAWGQSSRRNQQSIARRPTLPEVKNQLPAKTSQTAKNEVIEPIPLTARRLETAREGVDNQIRDQIEELKAKIKALFPDELDALSATGNWTPENRNALTKAVKAVDPAAVYTAWLQ